MQVTYANTILPLAELEAGKSPLVQSCIFPTLVSTTDVIRKASAEAERRIDAHDLMCRFYYFITLFYYFFSIFSAQSSLPKHMPLWLVPFSWFLNVKAKRAGWQILYTSETPFSILLTSDPY